MKILNESTWYKIQVLDKFGGDVNDYYIVSLNNIEDAKKRIMNLPNRSHEHETYNKDALENFVRDKEKDGNTIYITPLDEKPNVDIHKILKLSDRSNRNKMTGTKMTHHLDGIEFNPEYNDEFKNTIEIDSESVALTRAAHKILHACNIDDILNGDINKTFTYVIEDIYGRKREIKVNITS